jgi:ferredoxin
MSEEVYTRLREFLDNLPGGYPKTPSGVEIRILKKLFTPEDAELTMKLPREPEEVSTIAERLGMDEKELEGKLEDLCKKGLIYRMRQGGDTQYMAFQFIVGIYEFQLAHIDREFAELFEEYFPYLAVSMLNIKTPQMRVIPVQSSVDTKKSVAPYNMVREMVKDQEVISVQQCICRKEQGLLGHECDRPQEICIGFGHFAQFYIDNGWARRIDVAEAMRLLDKAEENALVLSPANARELAAICCCCPCCCPIVKSAKLMPWPQDYVRSYYEAKIDPELCAACGDCMERCQVNAIKEGDGSMVVKDRGCIGCGLCVSTCPEEAISMEELPGIEDPPKELIDVLTMIGKERGVI